MNDLTPSLGPARAVQAPWLDIVSDAAGLRRLRPEWDALLDQDPEAGIFLSHDWLAPGLLAHPGRWRIFVLRDADGAALCTLPAKYRLHWSRSRGQFQTEIEAAGRLAWGEYTGFVCRAGQVDAGLIALAAELRRLPWKSLSLRYVPGQHRARLFAQALGDGFTHDFLPYRINKGATDNLVSPQVPLDGDFDALLSARVSANTRQKIRRHRRKLLDTGLYRIEVATPETVEDNIAALLQHWVARWSAAKGEEQAQGIAGRYARALLTADAMGALYLPALWQGDRMLGALGHIVDRARGSVHFLVAGRDGTADDPAIGLLLHAHAIEWAIGQGLATYDFGHGDEPYKFSFGPDAVPSHYLAVRRSGDDAVFDPTISLRPALQRLAEFVRDGQRKPAEYGAAQLAAAL